MSYQIKKFLEVVGVFIGFSVFCLVAAAIAIHFYFAPIISNKNTILNNNDTGLVLSDDSGKPFFTFYQGKTRDFVTLAQIADPAEKAVVAVEDKEFFKHNGVSPKAILRSLIYDLQLGKFAFGGSTITQQLVKNTLLSPDKSLARKYREAILAGEIEAKYSKHEILEMYLNSVYFGEGAFGIEEAANTYFGKSASELNLAEASFLVAVLPSPSKLSPYSGDLEAAKKRQSFVLSEMQKVGDITAEEKKEAESVELTFSNQQEEVNVLAPHFALMVRDALVKEYGEEYIARSGLHVKTTLNSEWQKEAESVVAKNVERLASSNVSNGAVVVMNPKNGEVKALVGSADWYNDKFGKVNMATSARQPGSSFKPIVYGTAFEDRLITAATVLPDVETTFTIPNCQVNCTYKPQDYDNKTRGNVLVRRALANSLNIPAVHVMQKVGVQRVLEKSSDLNISSLGDASNYGLSMVLGAAEVPLIEMTHVYASFANRGNMEEVKLYTEIIDKKGKNINGHKTSEKKVWSEEVAYIISSILSDNRARAEMFGNALTISRPAAVKTGTTENYRDAWTLGYTPDLTIGVWVGNNDNQSMDRVAGSLGAAPIWRELMEDFSRGTPVARFTPPTNLVKLSICFDGGVVKSATTSASVEYFIPGTEPTKSCVVKSIADNSTPKSSQPSATGSAAQPLSDEDIENLNQQVRNLFDNLQQRRQEARERRQNRRD